MQKIIICGQMLSMLQENIRHISWWQFLDRKRMLSKKASCLQNWRQACCCQEYATGVYTSGVVFEPAFYEGFADMMKEDSCRFITGFGSVWFKMKMDLVHIPMA